MKVKAFLTLFLTLLPLHCESQDTSFSTFVSQLISENKALLIGRCEEDIILPCPFKSGSGVVIHWHYERNDQKRDNVYSYYKDNNQLENQAPKFRGRTSLFNSEIFNGNASLTIRRLSLLDEGIYSCYVGTASEHIKNIVELKVGAFHTPLMQYEKRNADSFLVCSILSVYPLPNITWKMDNVPVNESSSEKSGSSGPFYIKSSLNITGSNSSYECTIENSLLNQAWSGQWILEDHHHKTQNEPISLPCQAVRSFSPPTEDIHVTWSQVQNGTASVLAYYMSSSGNTTIKESRFSWNKELISQGNFSMTLASLRLSDSGEYLCNVSSSEYTLLIVHPLNVASSQEISKRGRVGLILFCSVLVIAVMTISWCFWKKRLCANRENGSNGDPANGDQSDPLNLANNRVNSDSMESVSQNLYQEENFDSEDVNASNGDQADSAGNEDRHSNVSTQ